jgi:hypothetical protein
VTLAGQDDDAADHNENREHADGDGETSTTHFSSFRFVRA